MAVTVLGKNYTQISGCETIADGGAWTGVDTQDATNYKEGTKSLCGTLKANGNNDADFVPTVAIDLSGGEHLRCWYLNTSGGLINTKALGGIQFYVSDGATTGYWYLEGRDTYAGGWINLVIDTSKAVDAGVKPVAMNAITSLGVRHNQTAGKNVDNVWIDSLCVCDGLIAYGDDGGGYFDFDDIFNADDTPATGGFGIVRKFGGQYFLTGSIEAGDSTGANACKFQAKSQVVIFENRPVNSNLYNITVVDNGTATTEFILGSKSGTQGIEGCTVRVADVLQTPKFDIIATDVDISDFKMYGSTILDADSIALPTTGTNKEVLNCNFESCGEILASTCKIENCNIISANGRGLRISSASHNVKDSNFINCPHCVHVNLSTNVTFDNLQFSGSDGVTKYDIEHSVSGVLTIAATNGANPNSSYVHETGGGSTAINNAVNITVTVKDEAGTAIENAQVAVYKTSDRTQLMNEDTLVTGVATEAFNYASDTPIEVRARKSSTGGTKYIPFSTLGEITSGGFSLLVTLQTDSNA